MGTKAGCGGVAVNGIRRWCLVGGVLLSVLWAGQAGAQEAPVAMLTEIKLQKGQFLVKALGTADWKRPLPLQSLRAGDVIRATGDAAAVLVYTQGAQAVAVSVANSPYTVVAPGREAGPGEKVASLMNDIAGFLMGKRREPPMAPLAVRGGPQPPTIIGPRESAVLSPTPTFEWSGARLQIVLRVSGPAGLSWERRLGGVIRLPYPSDAPRLSPGVEYQWEIETPGFPPDRSRFQVASDAEARRMAEDLAQLGTMAARGLSASSIAALRAGLLLQRGFADEARRELRGALARDPDEPVLHQILGNVYEQIGLMGLAEQEYNEAHFLLSEQR